MLSYSIQPSSLSQSTYAFVLDSYLIHIKPVHCTHCGKTFESCSIWEVHINPSLTGRTAAHRLLPAKTIRPGFAIGHSVLKPDEIPCCHLCYTTLSLDTSPPLNPDEWAKTLKRKYAPEQPKAAPVPRPSHSKKAPTLDDL